MSFQEWMVRTNTKPRTIEHYAGAVYGVLSRTEIGPVPSEPDLTAFDEFCDKIKKLESFKVLNEKGHRMYSSALSKYRQYLAFLSENLPLEVQDCQEIERDESMTVTLRTALVQARLGQGQYRKDLIRLWNGQCSVTGYSDPRVLVASHIKPWYLANNKERLDARNGLLLTPNLDKVFDKGLITFDPSNGGRILFSACIITPEGLGLSDDMHLSHCDKVTADFLYFHQKNVFLSPSR